MKSKGVSAGTPHDALDFINWMESDQLYRESTLGVVCAFINIDSTSLGVIRVLNLTYDCLFFGEGVNRKLFVLGLPDYSHELDHVTLDRDLLVGHKVSLFNVE